MTDKPPGHLPSYHTGQNRKITFMTREEAKQEIRNNIACTTYLEKSKHGNYICPKCKSGTHGNHTGAVKYFDDTNKWKCFKCGEHGDVLDLMQAYYGCDLNGAIAEGARIRCIQVDGLEAPRKPLNASDVKIRIFKPKASEIDSQKPTDADYTDYYKQCVENLKQSKEAVSYLSARGISLETAIRHQIGYDSEADPIGKGYKEARIILPSSKSFYTGRAMRGDSKFRYANVTGSPSAIFNMNAAYSDAGIVIITEGVFDALSIIEAGSEAIALNSVGNYKKFLEALKDKPADKVKGFVVAFDNDEGETGEQIAKEAEALKDGLQELGYNAICFNIAGDHNDINDALKADRGKLIDAIKAAERELQPSYLDDFFSKIQTDAYKPIPTGLKFFDDMLDGGVVQQSLIILMAAPGSGKTTLCQQLAEEMAAHQKQVIYINLEMSREQMLAKAVSYWMAKNKKLYRAAIDVLQGYRWTDEERQAITDALDEYRRKQYPYIKYNPANTGSDLDTILGYLRRVGEDAKEKGRPAPAVVIDYLHLISTSKGLDTAELIKQTVKGLKDYAVQYNTFVIGISATNRSASDSGQITLTSGRDSSNIEYTGDCQLSLNYYEVDNGTVKPTDVPAMAELQRANWKRMIIRDLKGRLFRPGCYAKVYFDSAHNIFYGANDWLPADTQDERPPFETENRITI